jgi:hypothetical protein
MRISQTLNFSKEPEIFLEFLTGNCAGEFSGYDFSPAGLGLKLQVVLRII